MGLDKSCKRWQGRTQTGREYGYLYVEGVRWYAHRWTFLQTNGYLPPVVRHACDHEWCVEPSHLLPGTQADNLRDMFERGRAHRARGEDVSTAKLSELDVMNIRQSLDEGEKAAHLARRHGVDHKTIRQIRDKKTWRHLLNKESS